MNKYLMMSAAALLATTGATGANAGTSVGSFQFGTAGGGSYCDGGHAYTNGAGLRAWQHLNNNCASGVSVGQGQLTKLPATLGGKGSDMSDPLFCQNYGQCNTYINYQLPKKIKNGAPWTLTIGFSGTTSFFGNSGVLINTGPAHKNKGTTSTVKNLKQLIQVHRNSR